MIKQFTAIIDYLQHKSRKDFSLTGACKLKKKKMLKADVFLTLLFVALRVIEFVKVKLVIFLGKTQLRAFTLSSPIYMAYIFLFKLEYLIKPSGL